MTTQWRGIVLGLIIGVVVGIGIMAVFGAMDGKVPTPVTAPKN